MIDLRLDHVSKRYRLRRRVEPASARPSLLRRLRNLRPRGDDFWAVRDVSFDGTRGETLGIIGHNGAGTSTILKLLSCVTTPTSGEITIYLSGSILGMLRREFATKLERIIEFAGSWPDEGDGMGQQIAHHYARLCFRRGDIAR